MSESELVKEYLPLLDPEEIKIRKNEYNKLVVTRNGDKYNNVKALRAFPFSAKEKYILLKKDKEQLDEDEKEELGIIEQLSALEEESRRILREELGKKYYIPQIKKVIDIIKRDRGTVWYVKTDKGSMSIEMTRRSETSFTSPNHLVLKDAEGNKYEVPDCRKLDEKSFKLIEREV